MHAFRWAAALGLTVTAVASAAGIPVTAKITYTETNHGKEIGNTTIGVTGRGTIAVAGKLPGVLARLPTKATYVTRYNIDAAGTYHALLLAKATGGSICLSGDVAFGKYKPGSSFPPTGGTFTTVGGTGIGAVVRVSGSYKITSVVGSKTLELTAVGYVTAGPGPPKPLTKACLELAKMGA